MYLGVVWNRMRAAVGLRQLTFHTLRYLFYVRSSGLPSSLTEQLVGHDDARTPQRYTRPLPSNEALARDKLSDLFAGESA